MNSITNFNARIEIAKLQPQKLLKFKKNLFFEIAKVYLVSSND